MMHNSSQEEHLPLLIDDRSNADTNTSDSQEQTPAHNTELPLTYMSIFRQVGFVAIPGVLVATITASSNFGRTKIFSSISAETLAAGGLISVTQNFIINSFGVLTAYANTMIGENKNNPEKVGAILYPSWAVSTTASIIPIILIVFSDKIFEGFGQPKDIAVLAQEYLKAFSIGLPPCLILYNNLSILRSIYQPWSSVITTFCQQSLTVSLGYLLVTGKLGFPECGVSGFGYAASLANWVTLVGSSIYLNFCIKSPITNRTYGFFRFKNLREFVPIFKELLQAGWPISVMAALDFTTIFYCVLLTGKKYGNSELSAAEIVIQYYALGLFPAISLGNTCGALVARALAKQEQNFSRELTTANFETQFRNAFNLGKVGLILSPIIPSLLFIFYNAAPNFFVSLMGIDTDDPENQEIVTTAKNLFLIAGVGTLIDSLRNAGSGILRGYKSTLYPMGTSIVSAAITLPLSFYFISLTNLEASNTFLARDIGVFVAAVSLITQWHIKAIEGIHHGFTTLKNSGIFSKISNTCIGFFSRFYDRASIPQQSVIEEYNRSIQ